MDLSLRFSFSADVYRSKASEKFRENCGHLPLMNLGGLRTQVPTGDITVKGFELMPFENELVILWLRGDSSMNFTKLC